MDSSNSIQLSLDQLPKEKFWDSYDVYQWEGSWHPLPFLKAAVAARSHFEARDDDVILASTMKTGSNWLKALSFCIMNRKGDDDEGEEEDKDDDPFTKNPPGVYVQTFESQVYLANPSPDLSTIPSPRLFHTHMTYSSLPDSIKNSKCKIVYITRNPRDTMVSQWHFFNAKRTAEQGPYPFEEAFEAFCNGVHPTGPFSDHVLQYWNQSLKEPHKMLFLKYEDLKRDPKGEAKKLASFLGRPFDKEEEVDKLVWRCSLERLKNLEVNKNGLDPWVHTPKSAFFRLGVVGDWKNYFTPEMVERLDHITRKKLEGSGLDL